MTKAGGAVPALDLPHPTSDINVTIPTYRAIFLATLIPTLAGHTAPALADLTIAHVAPLSGPVAIEAREYNQGIRLALAAANAGGGINGQKLVLKTEDDEYSPKKTVAALNRLAAGDTLATVLPIGSPAMSKVLEEKILEQIKLPMVGVIPGADSFRTGTNPYLFHVRAGDHEQYRKLVEHALTIGLKRIAVVYADIPFGKDGLTAITAFLRDRQQKPVLEQAVSVKGQADFAPLLAALEHAAPDMTIVVTPARLAGEFVRAYRARALPGMVAMPSYGNASTLCQIAGDANSRGVVLAQVIPNFRNTALPVVRQYQEALRLYGENDQKASLFQFEAFLTTRVLLEGIKRAGNGVTREKLVAALNSLNKLDFGGFAVSFSNTRHTGSSYVDISMVGRDCQLVY